jgi:hypothetical protein
VRQLWKSAPHRRKVLVVDEALRSELFPPGFPSELAVAAFRSGDEAAWPSMLAAAAVEWLSRHGYAVLGTELWVLESANIQTLPIGVSGMREVHGNTVNRESQEGWGSFVARAAAETRAYLQLFNQWDIVEPGEVYFNVVWVSEADYEHIALA